MKQITLALCAFLTLSACNSNPSAPLQTQRADTTGLSDYQHAKARSLANASELDSTEQSSRQKQVAPQQIRYVASPKPAVAANNSTANNGTGTTATPAKKGISKTAKVAIIGGVAGAAGGALINKKNRVAGAVVGGLLGAGAGAVIGTAQDKRDGRH